MNHAYILWIAMFAYAMHVFEEYNFDWKTWACAVLKLKLNWVHFSIVNGCVVAFGIAAAQVGWSCPVFALSFPAVMLVNATFFHVAPFIKWRGRFSPGLLTAVFLFYPIAFLAYWGASRDGILTSAVLWQSLLLGALLMATPVVMLKMKELPYFKQEP